MIKKKTKQCYLNGDYDADLGVYKYSKEVQY